MCKNNDHYRSWLWVDRVDKKSKNYLILSKFQILTPTCVDESGCQRRQTIGPIILSITASFLGDDGQEFLEGNVGHEHAGARHHRKGHPGHDVTETLLLGEQDYVAVGVDAAWKEKDNHSWNWGWKIGEIKIWDKKHQKKKKCSSYNQVNRVSKDLET